MTRKQEEQLLDDPKPAVSYAKRGPYKPRTKPTKSKRAGGRPTEGRAKNTVTMLPEAWEKLDADRGKKPRGVHLEKLLKISPKNKSK